MVNWIIGGAIILAMFFAARYAWRKAKNPASASAAPTVKAAAATAAAAGTARITPKKPDSSKHPRTAWLSAGVFSCRFLFTRQRPCHMPACLPPEKQSFHILETRFSPECAAYVRWKSLYRPGCS